jgi:Peptidase family M23
MTDRDPLQRFDPSGRKPRSRLWQASRAGPGRQRLASCNDPTHDRRLEVGKWGIPVSFVGLTAMLIGLGAVRVGADQTEATGAPTALAVEVPTPPRWMRGDDGMLHVDYDLLMTNWLPATVTLDSVTVMDGDGTPVLELTGEALSAQTHVISAATSTLEIPAGSSVATVIDVELSAGPLLSRRGVPRELTHTIRYSLPADIQPSLRAFVGGGVINGPTVSVERSKPPVLAPPLRGEFVNAVGCCDMSALHRRLLYAANGDWVKGETYAIDWIAIVDGVPFAGDGSENSDWYGFGATVTAAASGRVVKAVDGRPDIAPDSPPILNTPDDFSGNSVVVDIGRGEHVQYAHLQQGSVAVEVGQRVRVGDPLGLLGNSGNSTAPHLHFGVINGPDFTTAESLPWVFDEFTFLGTLDLSSGVLSGTPQPVRQGYPLLGSLVELP